MITYANAFDSQFCLLLIERRCASLADMQDANFEVESNIIAVERLGGDADRRRKGGELSSSSNPKIDNLAMMIEPLASELLSNILRKQELLVPLLFQSQIYIEEKRSSCRFCKEKKMQTKIKG